MQTVPIAAVIVDHKRRALSRPAVKALAASIAEVGLLNPITVLAPNRTAVLYGHVSYALVAGLHRLEACMQLGHTEIAAVVVDLAEADRHLAELDENLMRHDLSVLERAEHLAARKGWYEAKYPETVNPNKRGGPGRGKKTTAPSAVVSFAADTAAKTGTSDRAIREDVQIAESIPEDIRDMIHETPLRDRKKALLKIARLPHEEQRAAVEEATTQSASPSDEESQRRALRITIAVTVMGILTAAAYLDREDREELIERIRDMNDEMSS